MMPAMMPTVQRVTLAMAGPKPRPKTLAEGIVSAVKEMGISVPLVVRMEGTNVDEGKSLLKKSKLPIITADDLTEAAEKVVGELR